MWHVFTASIDGAEVITFIFSPKYAAAILLTAVSDVLSLIAFVGGFKLCAAQKYCSYCEVVVRRIQLSARSQWDVHMIKSLIYAQNSAFQIPSSYHQDNIPTDSQFWVSLSVMIATLPTIYSSCSLQSAAVASTSASALYVGDGVSLFLFPVYFILWLLIIRSAD